MNNKHIFTDIKNVFFRHQGFLGSGCEGGGGGSWYFAYGCGLYNEGGGQGKTHQIVGGKGFQKMQGKKSKITRAPPLHKL